MEMRNQMNPKFRRFQMRKRVARVVETRTRIWLRS